ncbi:hypothetical protein M2281_001020 [Mesorhizobium soli]|uniref:glycosyltransferase n=1 Tax=Pseudaminobacter soli (ex Li et al. 2025) TaxID=1295366 RepID=UPI002476772E|nr:glycosyltransferase [Mesorhizobium soli]MDH6230448.1 hypothetical protein [Mesorhizobium soli]
MQPILQRLKVAPGVALSAAVRARVNGTDFQTELLASGFVTEEAFFKALAEETGLTFVSRIDPDRLMLREADCLTLLQSSNDHKPVRVEGDDGIFHVIAPEHLSIAAFQALITRCPGLHARLRLTTPGALRKALLARAEPLLVRAAARSLFEKFPQYSAHIVASAWQGMVWGVVMAALTAAMMFMPDAAYGVVHLIFSLLFLACIALRFAALPSAQPPTPAAMRPAAANEMPVYSVLIALYDEAEMVPGLIDSLQRLSWPRSKLEIKLVCEADDRATLAAIRARPLPPHVEVIETPPYGLRTKPKALAYALPTTRGELVALFDAEDHPHPSQLIQAWQRFRDSDESLACVQAPLEIANRSGSLISRMFFFEYAALFRGLLPWLARKGLVLPLGGTSNHFRREALEKVGGWDPHNVTEDADLGLRLARFGYRSETISCPTMEDAPEDFGTWLPQRTRWFKGWIQTWLVHMRSPVPAGWRGWLRFIRNSPDTVRRTDHFSHDPPFDGGHRARHTFRHQGRQATRSVAIGPVAARHLQCRMRLPLVPASRLANAAAFGAKGVLEGGPVHPGLLADDLPRRLALGMAVVAAAPPLGKDRPPQGSAGQSASRQDIFLRNFGPSPTSFSSRLPTASRSRLS